ncbi:unnamed protein product [Mytilus edulis]|uniref:Paraneoplastic antigen Ma-like C-terminal domain-containing protein n=1 Tax=Mytilus edulis TaxID=6550 RepID=A0A8S3PPL0_MYTED|nr:unnamed protein product [Mytilus edulis]
MANPEEIAPEDIALLKLLKKEVGEHPVDIAEFMKKCLAYKGEESKPKVKDEPSKHTKYRDPPRISNFSGNNTKGETSYELWRYEVTGLMADKLYDQENINYAVRRSLKGDAGMVAMHLGAKASIPDILHKLDSIYGAVEKKEDLLAQFYRARQDDTETVTKWSCRLENIIGRAVDRGLVQQKERNGMLHSMLWTGLKTELKDISGHKFDTIKDFDELRVVLRQIETDHEERKLSSHKPQPAKATAISDTSIQESQMNKFEGLINQLTTRMDRWETDFRGRGSIRGRGYRNNRGYFNRNQGQYNRGGGHVQQQGYHESSTPQATLTSNYQHQEEKKCFDVDYQDTLRLVKNGDADGLSRIPDAQNIDSDSGEVISIESVQAICNSQLPNTFIESLAVNPDVVQSDDDEDEYKDEDIIDWKQAQAMDSQIAPFVRYVKEGRKPTTAERPTPRPRASKQQKLPVVHATKEDSADDTASTISEDSEVGFVLTADSESSLAEDSDANADISDEVTSLSGDAQIEETEPTGSASEDAESISSEDTTIDDDDVHQDTDELPPVEIRRSGRERRPPAWFRSGQFETSMAVAGRTSIPEWRQKADYISSLAQTPLFKATGLERDAARTILDIVNHH